MTESLQDNTDIQKPWLKAILIAMVVTGAYLFMSTRSTLWDRDETHYSQVAVEMVNSGNYLVPQFNGTPWLEKPILIYWLMSVPIRIFGPTEFACRFFSAIGTGLTCILTFALARKLVNTRAALWSMAILCSTSMVLRVGGSATIEPILMPFIVGALIVFVKALDSAMTVPDIILMGLAMGFGVLAKGPIGLLPIPVIIVLVWLYRRARPIRWRTIWPISAALAIASVIMLAWMIPTNIATHGELYRVFIHERVIGPTLKPIQGHGHSFWVSLPFYFPVLILDFFPWTLHLLGTISAVIGGRIGGLRGRSVIISWTVPIFILMSLVATKLPHYLLFIWPALAIATAGTIVAAGQGKLTAGDQKWLRRGIWLFGPLVTIVALGMAIGPWFIYVPGLRLSCFICSIVLVVMGIKAIRHQRADRYIASAKVLLVGMIIFLVPFLFGVIPAVEKIKLAPQLAQAINDKVPQDVPMAVFEFIEPSLNFYIGRHVEHLSTEQEVIEWAKQQRPGVLVIPKHVLEDTEQKHGDLQLEQIAAKEGFNYSKGDILELLAMARNSAQF